MTSASGVGVTAGGTPMRSRCYEALRNAARVACVLLVLGLGAGCTPGLESAATPESVIGCWASNSTKNRR